MNPMQQVIQKAMSGNPMMAQFETFVRNFAKMGKNPQQTVQELLNSGQMSQQQYESLRNRANSIMGTNY